MNAHGMSLSACIIQQQVQRYLWEWDAKPPILWAASLSQTTATRMTWTSRPGESRYWNVRLEGWTRGTKPWGQEGVGTFIQCFQSWRKSDTIGRKKCWIWSGFCSFGLGRMLVSNRLDVQYLYTCHVRIWDPRCKKVLAYIQGANCRSRMMSGMMNEMENCCSVYTRTCSLESWCRMPDVKR